MPDAGNEFKAEMNTQSRIGSTSASLWGVAKTRFIYLSVLKSWPVQKLKCAGLANSTVYFEET